MKVEPLPEYIPASLKTNVDQEQYFNRLHRFLRDLWERTGGGTDRIEANEAVAVRPFIPVAVIDAIDGFYRGTGAPASGDGRNGDFYFRTDGAAGTAIYYKASGSWSAIA